MPNLIKNGQLAQNDWLLLTDPSQLESLKDKKLFVPIEIWRNSPELVKQKKNDGTLGLFVDSHEGCEDLHEDFAKAGVIALNFPAFTDGRAYSVARELREFKNYSGELRAVGDVLHDQLNAMLRCGFDAFELSDDHKADKAILAFNDFSTKYQADLLESRPVYSRQD